MTGVFSNFSPVVGAAIMTNTPFIKVSGCRKKTTSFFVLHVLWLLVQINIFYHLRNLLFISFIRTIHMM